ncbi:hypothetical protein KDA23_05250, partial [Candidatus Saccharibacteria bacterium]|nr:hypothetical protein [Candidatus Saccharibacteria bacterium]
MAKKKAETKTFWQKYANERNFIILFIVIFIGSVVGLVLMSRQAAIDKERQQFMQAKSDLHSLYEDIVAEVGEPSEHKSVQECERASSKYVEGPLTCTVEEQFTYTLPRGEVPDNVVKVSNSVIKNDKLVAEYKYREASSYDTKQTIAVTSFRINEF